LNTLFPYSNTTSAIILPIVDWRLMAFFI
jgi:hypothetical protein